MQLVYTTICVCFNQISRLRSIRVKQVLFRCQKELKIIEKVLGRNHEGE